MKKISILTLLFVAFAWSSGLTATPDPIDQLVEKLSRNGLWMNGAFPDLGLPKTATPEQVIKRTFEMLSFEGGKVTEQKILQTRKVRIVGPLPDIYNASLIETNLGEKIVLFQYHGAAGWWGKVFDAKQIGEVRK